MESNFAGTGIDNQDCTGVTQCTSGINYWLRVVFRRSRKVAYGRYWRASSQVGLACVLACVLVLPGYLHFMSPPPRLSRSTGRWRPVGAGRLVGADRV